MKTSNFVAVGLFLFLISPFLFLIQRITNFSFPETGEFFWALKNSIIQALGSTLLALLLGFILAQGILWWSQRNKILPRGVFEFLCLMPGMLPALFTILFFLSLLDPFPMGLVGVVLIQGAIYSGFVAVVWVHVLEEKSIGNIEAAFALGASRVQIWRELIMMLKTEILTLGFFVFSICFTSFAIPVTVGGARGTTLEVLIYEKIRLGDNQNGGWNQALALSLIQVLFLFSFSLFQKKGVLNSSSRTKAIPHLGALFGFLLMLFFLGSLFFGFLFFTINGWSYSLRIPGLFANVFAVLPATVFISIFSGICIYFLILTSAFGAIKNSLRKFLIGFVAPSTTLAGLALIFIMPGSRLLEIILYILAFCTLVLASLYRMGFDQQLMGLTRQIEVAKILGASEILTFKEILFPQLHKTAARLGGIAALWVVGDFALSRIVFSNEVTLAQIVDSLVSSYRIEAASALMGVVIFLGMVVYLIFVGFGNVLDRKT